MATLHARLLTVEIHGGYLDGLKVDLASHTTCIIGGKGCGKTSLFELIRFVLGATSLSAKDARELLKKNLGSGTVRLFFETKHGVRYGAERRIADDAPRFITPDGAPAKVSPDSFQIEAYSQDEIEGVGKSSVSQLALIDRFADEEIRRLSGETADVSARLTESAKTLLELEAEIASLENAACEARAIEEQLRPLLVGTGQDAV